MHAPIDYNAVDSRGGVPISIAPRGLPASPEGPCGRPHLSLAKARHDIERYYGGAGDVRACPCGHGYYTLAPPRTTRPDHVDLRRGCYAKRRYDTRDRALQFLKRSRHSGQPYACLACLGWHITARYCAG